jgi:hypothetical protein
MKINKAVKQALALLAAITLTTIGPATANAAIVTNTFQAVNFSVFDMCTGEEVTFTGQEHIQENMTMNPNGSFHIHITENFAGVKGVGQTTGRKYQLPAVVSETENLTAAQEVTEVTTESLISDGSASNEQLRMLTHITMNANGTVTVDHSFSNITCTP